MNISHLETLSPVGTSTGVRALHPGAALEQGADQRPPVGGETSVTVSASGLAASRQHERPASLQKVLDEARADPAFGRRYLEQLSDVTTDGPLLDISHPPDIRLSSTGERWTDERQAQYAALSTHVMQQRRELIDAGLAAGHAPVDVLERIHAFNDRLPQWYKDGMYWE